MFEFEATGASGIFGPLGVAARLDGEASAVDLAPAGTEHSAGEDGQGTYRQSSFHYRNGDDTVRVRLDLRSYARFALAFVSGEARNENAFGRQKAFAARSGIVVMLRPSEPASGLMANYQHKDWWTRPFFDKDWANLPARTQSVLWKTASGYYHLLPVVGPECRTEAAGAGESAVALHVSSYQSGRTRCETLAFVLSTGEDPYRLVEGNVGAALKELDFPTWPRERKTYPEILDRLGWCSWDAFYHKVNEDDLLAKAEELQKLGLPVGWVMIDDGWSQVEDGELVSFEADPVKFPGGLKRAVSALKDRFGIRHVGVWHTIAGYWGGIRENSGIAHAHRDSLYRVPRGNLIPYPDAGRGFGFWHAWHGFLRRQGVDFVKVDSQSAVLNYLQERRPAGEAAAAAHEALEASVALHFNDTVINCMGMAAENIWHRPKSAVSRSSDDFVPQEKRGFPEHALQNGYNSFYHGAFYWGDWDMFWTQNHDDVQNAVLRSVSGGPVYISDAPGRTDPAKVLPLIYADGTIIRCDAVANPTEDCLLIDPTEAAVPLKLWNTAGGAGVVAAFHIHRDAAPVAGTIGPRDVPGLKGESFVAYEHFSRDCVRMQADERRELRLEEGGYALYTIVPDLGPVTPVGLADKYVSAAAVQSFRMNGHSAEAILREGGEFVFAARTMPRSVHVNGEETAFSQAGEDLFAVDCRGAAGPVRIEIATA
ncbi:Sip1-related alpha-galactosidase [Cohnella zeiphila]|uniref:Alpha-galactosidase n=1 Tax=Cohnella zeiphila TaxID=2761120 RepID=A0A7X0STF4_9BACL|nr:Sip1-related alpha-galactosidase [Cohnella zeiphila]MBB6735796.1 alpha-galactosidase [Cohnella zeiphila]